MLMGVSLANLLLGWGGVGWGGIMAFNDLEFHSVKKEVSAFVESIRPLDTVELTQP